MYARDLFLFPAASAILPRMSATTKPRIAIIGYGQFGRFMAKHLRPNATIVPIDSDTDPKKVVLCDIVIFAVPMPSLNAAITAVAPHVEKGALIADVTSVKQAPLALLEAAFPNHEIIGTHPIFGPQSGKHGIAGLPIVVTNVSCGKQRYARIKRFLKEALVLTVIEQTPEQHDFEMARVQALTHLIGRAITELDIASYATNTRSYKHLLELKELLKNDSWELFTTIQNANPAAAAIRSDFITTITNLEKRLH